MELGPTKEVKRRARRFRHDDEEARMKRLGTEGMEGQMPCPVGRRWFSGQDEDMTGMLRDGQ